MIGLLSVIVPVAGGLLFAWAVDAFATARRRRAWRLRSAGRLGLSAPTPPTDPTVGEVVLWMIDPSRGRK